MENFTKHIQVVLFERNAEFRGKLHHLFHAMELFLVSHVARLLGQNGRCFPLLANIKKHEPLGKRFTRLRSASHRFDVDAPILVEANKIQTAKGRSVLVLPADGGFDAVQLNLAGPGCKLLRTRRFAGARVERM